MMLGNSSWSGAEPRYSEVWYLQVYNIPEITSVGKKFSKIWFWTPYKGPGAQGEVQKGKKKGWGKEREGGKKTVKPPTLSSRTKILKYVNKIT